MRSFFAESQTWPIKGSFTIARGSKTEAETIHVSISENGVTGHGECVPYGRYDETVKDVLASIRAMEQQICDGLNRDDLQRLMARGAARNAIDCALWDLEAKLTQTPVWKLAGLDEPHPVTTAYTLSLASPDEMREAALRAAARPLLKLKLGGSHDDIDRVEAVREGAPHAILIVDANEAWKVEDVLPLSRELARLGVALIEQPLPAKEDEALRGMDCPVLLCADESAHGLEGVARLAGLYQFINIKLDKTGGLTEALSLARFARRRNLKLMAGCMVSTSLSMAPASLIAQGAEFVDLDGPLLLDRDREHAIRYEDSLMYPPAPELWG